jgi:hypothetical protein
LHKKRLIKSEEEPNTAHDKISSNDTLKNFWERQKKYEVWNDESTRLMDKNWLF